MNSQQYFGLFEQPRKVPLERPNSCLSIALKLYFLVEVTIHAHWQTTFQKDLDNEALGEMLDWLPLVRGDTYLKHDITKM